MMDIIEQITSIAINVPLVIVLLAIGAVCKHFLAKLDNGLIPIIMIITGVILAVLINVPFKVQDEILNVLVEGIVSGAAAVGLHTQGRTIWALFGSKTDASGNIIELSDAGESSAESTDASSETET